MRKSFHGLTAVARDTLKADPLSGAAFLFTNRHRKQRLRASMAGLPAEIKELIPDEVLAEPGAYDRIGEERSERLAVDPARYWRDVLVRPRFVRRDDPDAKPIIAPLPPALLEGSLLTASLGAHLLTRKFVYHQPFYRQQWELYHAHGIDFDRALMGHGQSRLADLLRPLWQLMAGEFRAGGYVQADETPVDYLEPGTEKAQTGYLWTYHSPRSGLILYDWQASRAHECLDAILRALWTEPDGEDFTGVLQSDGYSAYNAWIDEQPAGSITHVSSLYHIRRKFFEAAGDHPRLTGWLLGQIRQLSRIEARLREPRAGPAQRHAVRRAESLPIHRRLAKAFEKLIARHAITPRCPLGRALAYALKQWPLLLPAIEDGRIELDNNLVLASGAAKQKAGRNAYRHVFISFLAYCLYVTLEKYNKKTATGLSARSVLERMSEIQMLDVTIPATDGRELRMRRHTKPEKVHHLLLDKLGFTLSGQPPPEIRNPEPVVGTF